MADSDSTSSNPDGVPSHLTETYQKMSLLAHTVKAVYSGIYELEFDRC